MSPFADNEGLETADRFVWYTRPFGSCAGDGKSLLGGVLRRQSIAK